MCKVKEKINLIRPKLDNYIEIRYFLLSIWYHYCHASITKINKDIVAILYSEECFYNDLLDNNTLLNIVKNQEGKIIGILKVKVIDEIARIRRFQVHPNFRRQGIGTEILLCAICNLHDVKKFEVEVEQHDKDTQAFYIHQGFNINGNVTYRISNQDFRLLTMARFNNL